MTIAAAPRGPAYRVDRRARRDIATIATPYTLLRSVSPVVRRDRSRGHRQVREL